MRNINYNPDVLSCLANLSNDEVFTPPKLVNKILDMLPQMLFQNKETTFLDPVTKSGVFLREIAKRLNEGLKDQIPNKQERINHIFTKQVYGIAITKLTSLLARRSAYCSIYANGKYSVCTDFENEQGNIKYERIQHTWKNGKCIYCGASESKYSRKDDLETYAYQFIHTDEPQKIFNMKFDVIIGNPPYHLSDGGAQASAMPIYQHFINNVKLMKPRHLCMIIPSRWFAGGRGLNQFRNDMLNDTRIREIHDFLTASECFPGVEIKGGICYFHWNREYNGRCKVLTHENDEIKSSASRYLKNKYSDIFIRYNEAISILDKIKRLKEEPISKIMSSQKPFGLRTFYKGKKEPFINAIKVYVNKGIGYASNSEISINKHWIDEHKVIIPRAIGSGNSKSDLIKPLYSEPGSCCSETYIVMGPFASKSKIDNVISYVKTKFFHFLVTLQKNTMMAPKSVYSFVPIQNFNKEWNDEKLFKKYSLSTTEIEFVNNMVRNIEND